MLDKKVIVISMGIFIPMIMLIIGSVQQMSKWMEFCEGNGYLEIVCEEAAHNEILKANILLEINN